MEERSYIILLNYNGYKDTIECMESFLKSNSRNYCVIVVDNFSNNDSIYKLRDWMEKQKKIEKIKNFQEINKRNEKIDAINNDFIMINNKENKGFAAGNNVALERIINSEINKNDNVWILNNDTIIEKDALENLKKYIKENEFLGSVLVEYKGVKIQTIGGFRLNKLLGIPRKYGKNKEVKKVGNVENIKLDFVSGASIFLKVSTLRKVGIMPEHYFMYWEDCDWCYMARKKNIKMNYLTKSIVFHKEGGSIGQRSQKQCELDFKNCLKFFKGYYPKYINAVIINKLIINILAAIKNKKNVLVIFKASILGIKEYKEDNKNV